MTDNDALAAILEMARWAPSGDNTQPWRFESVDASHLVIHGFDTRTHCVYDLDGHPSQISLGALIETVAIAASTQGLRMRCARRTGLPESSPTFDLSFARDAAVAPDPLARYVTSRSVQRRPLKARPLTDAEITMLERSMDGGFSVKWLQGFTQKLHTARLMFSSAKIRLTMPEAYRVHRDVIEWNARFSDDRVPDQALGVDRLTTLLMRYVMKSWERVALFNRYFAGTWMPRIQMDFVPSLACGAHFVLMAPHAAATVDDYVAAGRALQRFWLTATELNLQLQPELTPLIFSRYARDGMMFSQTQGMAAAAKAIARRLQHLIGPRAYETAVFMGRVGAGAPARARSTRKPVVRLRHGTPDAAAAPVAQRGDRP